MRAKRGAADIKFLRARLLLDDLRCLLRGSYFRLVRPGRNSSGESADGAAMDRVLGEIRIRMKWREDLGEHNIGRFHNMAHGCRILDGTVVLPGQVFSLRRFLGGATEEQGFKAGPMFVRGRTEMVTGGGSCLISTLLFNAALQANLAIEEKHNHSTDMWGSERFIALGLDATYVYGRKDLKFRNTHGADIRIEAAMDEEKLELRCRFVSAEPLPEEVTIGTEIVEELHPAETSGQEGGDARTRPYRTGWIVRTIRTTGSAERPGAPGRCTYVRQERYRPFYLPEQR